MLLKLAWSEAWAQGLAIVLSKGHLCKPLLTLVRRPGRTPLLGKRWYRIGGIHKLVQEMEGLISCPVSGLLAREVADASLISHNVFLDHIWQVSWVNKPVDLLF